MLKLGDFYNVNGISTLAGVKNNRGIQCGILVNETKKITVLIQTISGKGYVGPYPNRWDEVTIGVLHFCGTNKGLRKEIKKQNLESKLNKHVNKELFPIHVFVRYPEHTF